MCVCSATIFATIKFIKLRYQLKNVHGDTYLLINSLEVNGLKNFEDHCSRTPNMFLCGP